MRAFAAIVLVGVAALAVTSYAGWDDTSAPASEATTAVPPTTTEPETTTTEPETTTVPPSTDPAQIVRAAAAASRPVEAVVCHTISDEFALCAVTFAGPSCQLWQVTDGNALGLPIVVDGARATRTGTGVRC